jgi:Alw26I/Eco31I/Esp3I family type II restriction m6 adenine DNA methyltransferase
MSTHLFTSPVPSRQKVDAEACEVRNQLHRRCRADFLRQFDRTACIQLIAGSSLAGHVDTFPATAPEQILAYGLFLTRVTIEHLVRSSVDPMEVAFVGSRVAELGMYAFLDPASESARPASYLGASKELGYFFTPPEVALLLAKRALADREGFGHLLDPAAGCGSLLSASLLVGAATGRTASAITAIEKDPFTASLIEPILAKVAHLLGVECQPRIITGDAIALLGDPIAAAADDNTRVQMIPAADTIVMNPPYGRLKFLRDILTNTETRVSTNRRSLEEQILARRAAMTTEANRFKALSRALGLGAGPQDFQRQFTALALRTITAHGRLAMITPSGWLGDRESMALRRSILTQRLLEEIVIFPEDSGLFATVNQPTAVSVFQRGKNRQTFRVSHMSGRDLRKSDVYDVAYTDIERQDPKTLRIPRLPSTMYHVFEHLQTFPRIRDVDGLRNARGELDQTAGKPYLTQKPSEIRFVRGDHIERYVLRSPEFSTQASYIDTDKFDRDAVGGVKYNDSQKVRIAGRQCSYMKKERRLSFAQVPAGVVLGNSCNYLCTATDNTLPIGYLDALLALLNSAVMEWYFRVYSSNNHVANYEIGEFPICLSDPKIFDALRLAGRLTSAAYLPTGGLKRALPIEDLTDALVAYSFGLNEEQTRAVVQGVEGSKSLRAARAAQMVGMLRRDGISATLRGEGWYQHLTPSLSELDREIIRHVPQGGNWQNIPTSVPSKRLEQIRQMSAERGVVRTTYYGRLRPDQPSYTIATYYNRPGNGTNIHPWENRTISHREAARLQSFPDYYYLLGTDTSMRKQIGNAVPPLLAYAVGAHLGNFAHGLTCIDLFAGSGGLSLGLELAGWEVSAAVDFDRHAIATYEFNRPCERVPDPASGKTLVLQADLHVPTMREAIISSIRKKLSKKRPSLLVGGPPCQGFSHAGFRQEDDSRNDLAMIFMTFVDELQPELVVLENVEGLLSYKGGQVVRDLILTLRELGYETSDTPWCLSAEQYGVPQMRRRVFIVGSRGGAKIDPPAPKFARCAGRRESRSALDLFPTQPYPFTVAEALADLTPLGPREHQSRGTRPVRLAYAQWLKGIRTSEQLVGGITSKDLIEVEMDFGDTSEELVDQPT